MCSLFCIIPPVIQSGKDNKVSATGAVYQKYLKKIPAGHIIFFPRNAGSEKDMTCAERRR
jgi:hypothetical protein